MQLQQRVLLSSIAPISARHNMLGWIKRTLLLILSVLVIGSSISAADAHDQWGVIDVQGNQIIPCIYKEIQHLPNGMFLLEKFNPANIFNTGDYVLADETGNLIECPVPSGAVVLAVVFPKGTQSFKTVPEGTIFIVSSHGVGVVDAHGKFIIPTDRYIGIKSIGDGLLRVVERSGSKQIVALKDGECTAVIAPKTPEDEANIRFWTLPNLTDGKRFILAGDLKRGLALAVLPKTFVADPRHVPSPKYVYVDESGKIASPAFDELEEFSTGCKKEVAIARLGDRFGLLNRQFKFVTSPAYSSLSRVAPDLYVGELGKTNRFILDSSGRRMFHIPSSVLRIVSASDGMVVAEQEIVDNEHRRLLYGIYSQRGKLLWTNKFIVGGTHAYGLFTAHDQGLIWLVNNTGQQTCLPQKAKVIIPVAQNRAIKIVTDDAFNSSDWKQMDGRQSYQRCAEFEKFLRDYDLIGMQKDEVIRLLGGADNIWLSQGDCGNSYLGLHIEYENELVKRWRQVYGDQLMDTKNSTWVTTNYRHDTTHDNSD
ncbi:MAG TPA: WG repeat-containing protein [Oculatellaceae cyanobacterium]